MADSDDEYDRRRRDKFRRERSDYDRSREREERRRDDWNDREWDRGRERRSRGEYRDYDRSRRDRFSPPRREMSPVQKRMRRDWDDHIADPYHPGYEVPFGGTAGGPAYGPPPQWPHGEMHVLQHHGLPIQARLGNLAEMDIGPPAPVMKSFKEFLLSLDDSVDETEAVKRYNDYKLDFRRQQMQDFFLAHKDEEWFRSKYHPDEVGKRKQEAASGLRNRLNVFMYLMENHWFDNIMLDHDKATAIIKLLDAAVIKMEGGTDHDLKILEIEEEEEKQKAKRALEEARPVENDKKASDKEEEKETKKGENSETPASEEKAKKSSDAEEEKPVLKEEVDKEPKKTTPKKLKKSKKRKRKRSGDDSDEDDCSASETDSESEGGRVEEKVVKEEVKEIKEEEKPKPKDEPDKEKETEKKENGKEDSDKEKEKKETDEKPVEKEKEDEVKPRPLHRTCSLFMRNIAPNISRAEIVALCKRFPGFIRVALSEPHPERRFFRRGWVKFDRSVNIKEICWNLQNIRLRECELSPLVNRDLTNRVRTVNGITQHKPIVRNDIKLAAKLIHMLDDRTSLWNREEKPEANDSATGNSTSVSVDTPMILDASIGISTTNLPSQNPILKNITDYLIEEVSAEEDELLGKRTDVADDLPKDGAPGEIPVERDDKLIKVLDKLLLYLRIVHSLDYYNTCEYPNEDEMPNRCGMIHVRATIALNRVTVRDVMEWQKTFEDKLVPLFTVRETLSEEEAHKMGKKDPDQEVEKFVTANTQELGKDKWLCPLSGKKFKGPEFVRKHIYNKHSDKIEEVKKEVAFFNNFLLDAKRPALPELKPAQPLMQAQITGLSPGMPFPHQTPQQTMMAFGQPRPPLLGYGGGPFPPAPYAGRGNYDFRGQGYPGKPRSRMLRGDPRHIVEYRDLDAPEDVDFF